MNTRTVRTINIQPEAGPAGLTQETYVRRINQALNDLNQPIPPFSGLVLVDTDKLSNLDFPAGGPVTVPKNTLVLDDSGQTALHTFVLQGVLKSAKVQFPRVEATGKRTLRLKFACAPAAPVLTTAPTGGTVPSGVYYVALAYVFASGESALGLPAVIQTLGATSTLTVQGVYGETLTDATAYRVYIGAAPNGPFYLQNGAGTTVTYPEIPPLSGRHSGTSADYTRTTPPATSGTTPTTSPVQFLPTLIPGVSLLNTIEPLPSGVIIYSADWQSDGVNRWHLLNVLSAPLPTVPPAPYIGGIQLGQRWPTAGANITITADDFSIYGTSGQHCNNVTFPLASAHPGQYLIFTYPPGGSLIPSGSDTIDGYANQTAAYQSDGVSVWRRMWSV